MSITLHYYLLVALCFCAVFLLVIFQKSALNGHRDPSTKQLALESFASEKHTFLKPPSTSTNVSNRHEKGLKLPLPIIVLSFPKSGTTSVHHFFSCSGVTAQHFCCCGDESDHPPCEKDTMSVCILKNMAKNRKMLENCGNYQVYCQLDGERPILRDNEQQRNGILLEDGTLEFHDTSTSQGRNSMFRHFLPQHFNLDRLHLEYPTATYLMPLRDREEWAMSALRWYQMRGRFVNEYVAFNSSIERPGKKHAKEFLMRIYDEHTQLVRRFVHNHPEHALVEFNISDPNAGKVLADAFGLREDCWGHHNKIAGRGNKS